MAAINPGMRQKVPDKRLQFLAAQRRPDTTVTDAKRLVHASSSVAAIRDMLLHQGYVLYARPVSEAESLELKSILPGITLLHLRSFGTKRTPARLLLGPAIANATLFYLDGKEKKATDLLERWFANEHHKPEAHGIAALKEDLGFLTGLLLKLKSFRLSSTEWADLHFEYLAPAAEAASELRRCGYASIALSPATENQEDFRHEHLLRLIEKLDPGATSGVKTLDTGSISGINPDFFGKMPDLLLLFRADTAAYASEELALRFRSANPSPGTAFKGEFSNAVYAHLGVAPELEISRPHGRFRAAQREHSGLNLANGHWNGKALLTVLRKVQVNKRTSEENAGGR